MIALFWNPALALISALHCYRGDNVKYGLLSKYLFQRKQQYGGCENLSVKINVFQLSHETKSIH